MARTYIIVATSAVTDLDYGVISKNSLKNVRLNNAGTKCIISFTGTQPARFDAATEYNAPEMRAIANSSTNEWYRPPADMADDSWYVRAKDVVSRYNPFDALSQWI